MRLKLINKFATKTSRGMLSKGWYVDENGVEYLVKGNSCEEGVIGYEPYSEVIAYRIGKLLGLPVLEYRLIPREEVPDIKVYGNLKHLSICRNYNQGNIKDIKPYWGYMKMVGGENSDLFSFYRNSGLNVEFLFKMLVFDAVIGNTDRHLNNFDVEIVNGKPRNTIIYDNGASLLAWKSYRYVSNMRVSDTKLYADSSKPFKRTHYQQVRLVRKYCNGRSLFGNIDKEYLYRKILEDCEDVFALMPEYRSRGIKIYLKNRLNYLF